MVSRERGAGTCDVAGDGGCVAKLQRHEEVTSSKNNAAASLSQNARNTMDIDVTIVSLDSARFPQRLLVIVYVTRTVRRLTLKDTRYSFSPEDERHEAQSRSPRSFCLLIKHRGQQCRLRASRQGSSSRTPERRFETIRETK